ncbi:hypothetical protein Taro_038511 [Colocasia esculenta]|uniref:Uncharacterized protein n=1 Tax=Colocasia esculenta TaxID=4460 RepID=A0A843WD07_COLES|nr:hypothetical protein [Colocasia esculenta]
MSDRGALVKARQELEDLYVGVPDESVDLTFKDMVSFQHSQVPEKKGSKMEPIHEERKTELHAPGKSPHLDSPKDSQTRTHLGRHAINGEVYRELVVRSSFKRHTAKGSPARSTMAEEHSHAYEDTSGYGRTSRSPYEERAGGRRRPGIPHSKICSLCSVYVYIFLHRCLVCGRAYCRQCVGVGMGEMTEGRKCIDCLGMRFSQRYIRRAGKAGCCCSSRYPTAVMLQELNWAEKGPRRSGERGYERSGLISEYAKSTVRAATPTRAAAPHIVSTSQASFDTSRARSPASPRSPRSRVDGAASFVASPAHPPTVYATPF